ncbi:hypothetical protein [Sphingomonas sp. IBVSS2]|uniref:hypothetical protein n=1 Tax=Sphingomonas sp. IBVSS2 TaxID=1985172 RepID=UPI001181B210|nr:hypothetical protein [Sphingomonas sp. IBVSS2]
MAEAPPPNAVPPRSSRSGLYIYRGSVAAAALALAIGSVASAMTGVFRGTNALAALRISPKDPVALAREIDNSLLMDGETTLKSGRIGPVARQSLEGTALNPEAVRLLAIDAGLRNDAGRSAALLRLAERLSRRDLGTQLLLIEEQVAADDVPGTLAHYDKVLRASPQSRAWLFSTLGEAASDPAMAAEIARMLRRDPPWLGEFIDWTIFEAAKVDNLGGVFAVVPPTAPRTWTDDRKRALIGKFAGSQPGAAFRLYRLYAGDMGDLVRDGAFEHASLYPPISWETGGGSDVEASLGQSGAEFGASNGGLGKVLSQMLALAPAKYVLTVRMRHDVADPAAAPQWSLACVGTGAPIAKLAAGPASDKLAESRLSFEVPAGCGFQWLRLELHSVESVSGQHGTVERVRIDAVR